MSLLCFQLLAVEMDKFTKVVLVLAGCYSGCKAIILRKRNIPDGTSDAYSHTLVAATAHYHLKVTAAIGKKKNHQEIKDQVLCEYV